MDAHRPGFPFRFFFPLAQLLLCLVLLWPHLPVLTVELKHSAQRLERMLLRIEEPEEDSKSVIEVTPVAPQGSGDLDFANIRLTAPAALNLPVGFIQIPYVIATPTKTEWVPKDMWTVEWRAASWPLVGMIFWWMAGRGLEALGASGRRLVSPRLHWIELVLSLSFLVLGSAVCYVIVFDKSLPFVPSDQVFAVGGGLWAILGATSVVVGILQWRIRRKEKQETATATEIDE